MGEPLSDINDGKGERGAVCAQCLKTESRKGGLCAHVPNLREYSRVDPCAIQSLSNNTQEERSNSAQTFLTTVTLLRTMGGWEPLTHGFLLSRAQGSVSLHQV